VLNEKLELDNKYAEANKDNFQMEIGRNDIKSCKCSVKGKNIGRRNYIFFDLELKDKNSKHL